MQFDQLLDEGQADTEATLRTLSMTTDLRKQPEDVALHLGRNAYSIVADGDDSFAAVRGHRQFDRSAGWRVFCCVGQQVGDDLRHAGRVRIDPKICGGDIELEGVCCAIDKRAAGLGR